MTLRRHHQRRGGRWVRNAFGVGTTLAALFMLALPAVAAGAGGVVVPLDWRWTTRQLPEPGEGPRLPEYFGPLDRARALADVGRMRGALWELREAPTEGAAGAEATLIRARALRGLGATEKARESLAGVETIEAELLRARLAADGMRIAEAREIVSGVINAAPNQIEARLLAGELAEEAADFAAARDAYGWFVEQRFLDRWVVDPDDRRFELAPEVTAIARALDRHATLTGRYRDDPTLHDAILNMFVRAYDVIDREYWPARLAAARFTYDRGDRPQAAEELAAVLSVAPFDARALSLAGRLALDRFDFGTAEAIAAGMRWMDPASREADLLEGRSMLLARQPGSAEPVLRRLLGRGGGDVEALGVLAAMHALRLEEAGQAAALAEAERIAPGDPRPWFEVGRHLAVLRQYPRAEAALREALERAPWWTHPRNELALLLTQSGDDVAARGELRVALDHDPFNRRALNFLRLLEEMADYERLETRHFTISFDPEHDALVAELFGEILDGMFDEVTEIYGWEPDVRTQIQIFPTHDRFSVRVAGDPYVGTVGACTGPVIAMLTPRGGAETLGPYNWPVVLRHEFTHTVTLGRTENRIAHWLTEGIAVREEHSPVRQQWMDLLATAWLEGELFGVEELTWGFIRPRQASDRPMAYAQSWHLVEYLDERWGGEALAGLMDAHGAGLSDGEAVRRVLEIEPAELDEAFAEWMGRHVEAWGRLPEQTEAYEQAVLLGEAALQQEAWEQAAEAFERAREVRPNDVVPMQRLAGLRLAGRVGEPAEAVDLLVELHRRTGDDNRFAKRAVQLLLEQGRGDEAVDLAEGAIGLAPYDRSAHELLREAAEAVGDQEAVERQERRLELLAASRPAAGGDGQAGPEAIPGELHHPGHLNHPGHARLPADRSRQGNPDATLIHELLWGTLDPPAEIQCCQMN